MCSTVMGTIAIVQLLFIFTVSEATSFGCKNTLISDTWRQAVLDYHNNQRRKVALGNQATGGGAGKFMPKADDMYELSWDCNLEDNAFLSICGGTVQVPATFSSNTAAINLGGANCNIKDRTMTILKGWWNQATATDLSGGAKYDDTNQKQFGIMVNGATTGLACSYNKCSGGNGEFICLYNTPPPANQADLYTTAQANVCAACPAQTDPCTNNLCKPNAYTPVDNANPQPICADDGMTFDMETTATDMANYYRSLVATGWAQDKNGYAPTAKALNALEYDCTGAGMQSKTLADNCQATSYTAAAGYTMSFYRTNNFSAPREDLLKQAFTSWFAQLKNVNLDDQATYDNNVQSSASDFANILNGDATSVGCAVTQCAAQGFAVAICQYDGPQLNAGDPLYQVGKTCSGCTAAQKKCDDALHGICVNP